MASGTIAFADGTVHRVVRYDRDPQTMKMNLKLNGQIRQDASTSMMIFPVAAIIEFISSFVTLEPGDIISTGTPSGVGSTTGTFVKPGDKLEATIEQIGTLVSRSARNRKLRHA